MPLSTPPSRQARLGEREVPPPRTAAPSLLAVFAHPDDESIACGGLLARCAAEGVRASLLCLTRGGLGELAVVDRAQRFRRNIRREHAEKFEAELRVTQLFEARELAAEIRQLLGKIQPAVRRQARRHRIGKTEGGSLSAGGDETHKIVLVILILLVIKTDRIDCDQDHEQAYEAIDVTSYPTRTPRARHGRLRRRALFRSRPRS